MQSKSPTFYGWRVVGGAFVLAVFGLGIGFHGPAVYLHAVHDRHGWPLALISTAVTLHFLVGSIVVANLPELHRRFGVPAVTKTGATLLAIGICGWAVAAAPWQLFAASIVSGAGWVTMGVAAINAIVSPWFVRRRPAALALAYHGANIGGVIFSPLWAFAIGEIGFPLASIAIGAVMVATMWGLADRIFAHTPEQMGLVPDGDGSVPAAQTATSRVVPALPGSALWRDRKFLSLATGMALGLFAQIGLTVHLYSLLVPAFGPSRAGLAMGLVTLMAVVGRSLIGWTMPADADRRLLAAASYVVQIVGSLAFIAADGTSTPLLLLGVVLFGIGFGNGTYLPPLIAQAEFAGGDVPRVVALIVAISQAAYAFAPLAFGTIRELTAVNVDQGAAPALFATAAAIQVLATCAFMVSRAGRPSIRCS
jgi:MFS family permease